MRLRQTRVDELATHAVVRTTGSGKDESRGVVAGTGEGSRGVVAGTGEGDGDEGPVSKRGTQLSLCTARSRAAFTSPF